jgi:hypothetical protein
VLAVRRRGSENEFRCAEYENEVRGTRYDYDYDYDYENENENENENEQGVRD